VLLVQILNERRLSTSSTTDIASDAWITSATVYLLPFSFFYYFLYYTDTCSLCSFLIVYWLCVSRQSGSCSGLTVWSAVALFVVSATVLLHIPIDPFSSSLRFDLGQSSSICILMRQTNAVWILYLVGTQMLRELQSRKVFADDSLSIYSILAFLAALWKEKVHLLTVTTPLLIPIVVFALFVLKNGSVVVGGL
jgi:hypothetical protein